ncbi:cell division cycle protein-like protein [Leishmania major strain Friedlin]|uniref:Cell division cycle protein-like protein n=1 Tax=Leishmania major TaxID=5664 RepID=Q4QCP1_LEIMA|nr:cell division cycle protein-like protein [Leishmania major strain Friedlin]CAJ04443.1 cell division cycle protein-like protein [Leishmania major strain Friedlin]|eukprot:XP_001682907.1 cell division cycle protein-like protein [Leishmania major strain Friedlin]
MHGVGRTHTQANNGGVSAAPAPLLTHIGSSLVCLFLCGTLYLSLKHAPTTTTICIGRQQGHAHASTCMAGFTDALVLEAPVLWWPAVGDLPRYPIDEQRSFVAAIVEAAMPWPQGSSTAEGTMISTLGLSCLGRSVMMTAEWSCLDGIDSMQLPSVKVWNPLQGCAVYMTVSTEAGLGSLASANHGGKNGRSTASLTELDLRQLARDERVRVTHRSLREMLSRCCCSRTALLTHMQRCAEQREEYALLHRAVTRAHAAALKHLERAAQAMDGVLDSSHRLSGKAAISAPFLSSLLFAGDTPSQRHLLRLLQATTPSVVQVSSTRVFVLEARRLNLAEVLALLELEALEVVEAVLRPPPLCASAASSSSTVVYPCLLIVMESLHLLEGNANSLVASVTHQLCVCLDALQASTVPAIVWSFTEDVLNTPPALLTRVGAQQERLAMSTAEDRIAYLTRRLARWPPVSSLQPAAWHTAAVKLAESTAHWTVGRLVLVRDADLASMLPSAPAVTREVSDGASRQAECLHEERKRGVEVQEVQAGVPASSAISVAAQRPEPPLFDVYSRLYGIEEAICKVEELIVWPLTHLLLLRELAIPCTKGVLLCGPSGSGKTALLSCLGRRLQLPDARRIHVMSVDGLSLITKEVGRSEKNIAQLFDTARSLAPTALFIDNLDSLAPPRGRTTAETNTTGDRTLSTLLTQMDGVGGGQADCVVVVVASAPSIDTLDPAVCRPGRLDVHVQLTNPPTSASAAVMKNRLREFVARMQKRRQSDDVLATGDGAGTATLEVLEEVDQLVDEYLASVTAKANSKADGDATLPPQPSLSPAEVTAAIREVMLDVVARLERGDSPTPPCATLSSDAHVADRSGDVVRAVRDAVRHLYAAA